MNTKMLFFLIASLLITNGNPSIATAAAHTHTAIESTTQNHVPGKRTGGDDVTPIDITVPNPVEKVVKPNSDDDGKHHHFHFDRITCVGGRRLFLLCLSKLILFISQVCCFLYCVTHVFH